MSIFNYFNFFGEGGGGADEWQKHNLYQSRVWITSETNLAEVTESPTSGQGKETPSLSKA